MLGMDPDLGVLAHLVCVLYPEDPLTTGLSSKEMVVECCPEAADME